MKRAVPELQYSADLGNVFSHTDYFHWTNKTAETPNQQPIMMDINFLEIMAPVQDTAATTAQGRETLLS